MKRSTIDLKIAVAAIKVYATRYALEANLRGCVRKKKPLLRGAK